MVGSLSRQLALQQALEVALAGERHLEAAQLARALNRRSQAAQLYAQAEEYFEAAVAFRESGQASHALRAALKVEVTDPCYFAAARLVIELSAALRSVTHQLDAFVESYLVHPPASREDMEAWFLLAQIYEVHQYTRQAIALYRRISAVDPSHAATMRLRLAEAGALKHATMEIEVSIADVRAVRELSPKPEPVLLSVERCTKPGTMIANRYRVVGTLGSGSSATVLQVHDMTLREDVALKLLNGVERDATQAARFRREVSLARKLAHPNIVRLFDLGEHHGQSFLTMELLDGKDLSWEPDQYSLPMLRSILLQVLDGLGYAHANHVIHRDIKPENLFITTQGVVKIADFGIARAFGDARITRTGSMGGTPYYMSPEQITDFGSADHRTDLYAFGVVAYELFTGRVPFDAEGLTPLLMQHLEEAPAAMRSLKPELSPELDALVLRLLAKPREARFQSCAQVAAALSEIPL